MSDKLSAFPSYLRGKLENLQVTAQNPIFLENLQISESRRNLPTPGKVARNIKSAHQITR